MKRTVLIVITTLALLTSEALTLLATRAAAPQKPMALQAQSLGFFYKQDAPIRYQGIKTRWKALHKDGMSLDTDAELNRLAYEQANVEAPLEEWRFQGGPSPGLFSSKLHLYNNGSDAMLNVPLKVVVRAYVGELQPDPVLKLTDYDRLENSARWEDVSTSTVDVPAVGPGSDKQVEVMRFELLPFLKQHGGKWPLKLDITVSAPNMAPSHQELTLIPDHFAIPSYKR